MDSLLSLCTLAAAAAAATPREEKKRDWKVQKENVFDFPKSAWQNKAKAAVIVCVVYRWKGKLSIITKEPEPGQEEEFSTFKKDFPFFFFINTYLKQRSNRPGVWSYKFVRFITYSNKFISFIRLDAESERKKKKTTCQSEERGVSLSLSDSRRITCGKHLKLIHHLFPPTTIISIMISISPSFSMLSDDVAFKARITENNRKCV